MHLNTRKGIQAAVLRLAFLLTVFGLTFFNLWDFSPVRAACTIQGLVYRDYNNNAQQDPNEPGQPGVTVNAYFDTNGDGISELVATTASIASNTPALHGSYTLPVTAPDGEVRVEFSGLPTFVRSGRFGAGNNSTTTVTFVNCAGGGTVGGIDLAVANPGDYCHAINPELGTSCYVFDDQFNPAVQALPAFVAFPYTAMNADPHRNLAAPADIGTTFGLGYHRATDSFFVGSFIKRHAGLGPGAGGATTTGAIYRIRNAGTAPGVTPTVSLFMDLNAAPYNFNTGADPHPTAPFNCPPSWGVSPPALTCWQHDKDAYVQVGKAGLGDVDISDDDLTLYAINLNRPAGRPYSELLQIPIGLNGTAPGAGAIRRHALNFANLPGLDDPVTGCPASVTGLPGGNPNLDDVWPFGMGVHNGLIYIGIVCTAQSTGLTTDLRAYIYSFDPVNTVFAQALTFPLDGVSYPRAFIVDNAFNTLPAEWQPWTDAWPPVPMGVVGYAEPWITDIVFDNDHMLIGFRDRMGDRTGNLRLPADANLADTAPLHIGMSGGDVVRACYDPVAAVWNLENNATCGGITTAGAGTGEGPGGGEYYYQDGNSLAPATTQHDEVTIGGMVDLPGFGEFAVTAYDPLPPNTLPGDNGLYDGGVVWMDHTTGARAQSYRLVNGDIDNPPGNAPPNGFGKGNGLGDLEAVCGPPPLEIGNRIWEDLDNNGIQDPNEMPLAGVIVQLYMDREGNGVIDPATELVGRTTTSGTGEYYFNETNVYYDLDIGGSNGGILGARIPDVNFRDINGNGQREPHEPIGLMPDTLYEVRLDDPANYGGGVLTPYYITPNDQIELSDTRDDVRDSDGSNPTPTDLVSAANFPLIRLTTGGYGDNNHTYDFGFSLQPPVIITITPPLDTPVPGIGFTLEKTVDNPFAQPGEIAVFTITVSNPNPLPFPNVVVTDEMPPEVQILSVSDDSPTGTTTWNGQLVTFTQPVLNPGEVVRITIRTRVRADLQPPYDILNEVTGNCNCSAQAHILSVSLLPRAGESVWGPLWLPIITGAILLVAGAGVWLLRRRRRAG